MLRLRWKKNPKPKGLARVFEPSSQRGSFLYDGKVVYARTNYKRRFSPGGPAGWYWVASGDNIPRMNSCAMLLETEEAAKIAAKAYVEAHLKKAESAEGQCPG